MTLVARQALLFMGFSRQEYWSVEKEMATHSSILAWRIAWTEEPGRLQSMGSNKKKKEYWSGLPFPPSGDLPDPGIKLISYVLVRGILYH